MISNRFSHSPTGQKTLFLALIGFCSVVQFSGCSKQHPVHEVDGSIALMTLTEVLDGWKEGKKTEDFQSQDPQIVVQDFDWSNGDKLESYELLDQGKAIDANMHCEVRLHLNQGGTKRTKQVTYLVGTSPVLTVFRAMLQ